MPNISGIGPVVTKAPLTDNAALNVAAGGGVAAVANYGVTNLTHGPEALAMGLFLNLIAQPIKKLKWFPEQDLLIPVLLVIAFLVSLFIVAHGDMAKSFINASAGTFLSLLNYKADKASGFNIIPPTPTDKEYRAKNVNITEPLG